MKRTVLTFGLRAGAVLAAGMLVTMPFHDEIGFDRMMLVGYSTMVLAFLLVFFGVRSYRDRVAGGRVGFGRAFLVGVMITAVASACYVATWQVLYYGGFVSDFLPEYQAHVLEQARADGASEAEITRRRAEMERFAVMYRNPAVNAALTLLEPLPVGLVFALVSAGVLRRREEEGDPLLAGART